MELNKNTYVSVEEADSYISSHYLSSDNLRRIWEETTITDKEILLVKACQNLEGLKYKGSKYRSNQELSFPRGSSDTIPTLIKAAQVEEAVGLLKKDEALESYKRGIKAESIDGISITYDNEVLSKRKLNSVKANELVRGWLYGTFKVY